MKKINILIVLVSVLGGGIAIANENSLEISAVASYYDENLIQDNILSQCNQLGSQFSESTAKNLQIKGFSVSLKNDDEMSESGESLKLKITNAMSSGNAFTGHRKTVTIIAELYKDGELVDKYKHTRNSGGGFLGGFKGSCSVLQRCVNTLGRDVAKWLHKKKSS